MHGARARALRYWASFAASRDWQSSAAAAASAFASSRPFPASASVLTTASFAAASCCAASFRFSDAVEVFDASSCGEKERRRCDEQMPFCWVM